MRRIFLDVVGRRHSLYDELLDYPPEGYEFVTDKSSWSVLSEASCRTDTMGRIPRQFLRSLLPLNLAKSYLERFKSVAEDTYMTYSSGHLVFRNEPWVVDLEYVTHLSDYSLSHFNTFRGIIESELRSENCKRIMPWTDSGRDTILSMIHDDRICEKVETVRLAVRGKDFRRQYGKDRVRFLFVGSANMPRAFDIKGGKEVIEAFLQLTQRYKNLELVVRSYVPSKLKEKLASIGNIRIIDRIVPFEVLESEFQSADIFLFPSHNTPGMVLLDAMSYELPVITTDELRNGV
jgi:glycosyltransferase involved in cell wall biosynthesis